MSTPDQHVSTSEAAHAIGVSRATLVRWASAGQVEPARTTVGGHMRWDVEDLERQLAAIQEERRRK